MKLKLQQLVGVQLLLVEAEDEQEVMQADVVLLQEEEEGLDK